MDGIQEDLSDLSRETAPAYAGAVHAAIRLMEGNALERKNHGYRPCCQRFTRMGDAARIRQRYCNKLLHLVVGLGLQARRPLRARSRIRRSSRYATPGASQKP